MSQYSTQHLPYKPYKPYSYDDKNDKKRDKQPLVQEVIERTTVDVRLPPYPYPNGYLPTPQTPVTLCSHIAVSIFCLALIVNYMADIYFSLQVDNMNMSMWLTINGFLGTFISLNGIVHWNIMFYPEGCCKPCFICTKVSHILGTMLSFSWTILGWIFFFYYPKETSVPIFETFMWCQLSFQTLLTVFYMYVAYLFIRYFYTVVVPAGQ